MTNRTSGLSIPMPKAICEGISQFQGNSKLQPFSAHRCNNDVTPSILPFHLCGLPVLWCHLSMIVLSLQTSVPQFLGDFLAGLPAETIYYPTLPRMVLLNPVEHVQDNFAFLFSNFIKKVGAIERLFQHDGLLHSQASDDIVDSLSVCSSSERH